MVYLVRKSVWFGQKGKERKGNSVLLFAANFFFGNQVEDRNGIALSRHSSVDADQGSSGPPSTTQTNSSKRTKQIVTRNWAEDYSSPLKVA